MKHWFVGLLPLILTLLVFLSYILAYSLTLTIFLFSLAVGVAIFNYIKKKARLIALVSFIIVLGLFGIFLFLVFSGV
jgi:hypothetical protein